MNTDTNPGTGVLVSIQLASNRPENLVALFDNIEQTADNPGAVEICIKIDDDDAAMNALLAREAARRPFAIKYISTPLPDGFFGLWRSMNDLLAICDPDAYFLVNFNDEMSFGESGWDTTLAKYVGFFPDHLFRIRTSRFRHRAYHDVWECGYAPETSAFTTKHWIDTQGDWNPCTGPDSFQQMVAFYLGRANWPGQHQFNRDVPVDDIAIGGEGAFIGLEGEALAARVAGARKAWFELMSSDNQMEAFGRARLLQAAMRIADTDKPDARMQTDTKKRLVHMYDDSGQELAALPYRLNCTGIFLVNFWRRIFLDYYTGGGDEAPQPGLRGGAILLLTRFPRLRRLYLAARGKRLQTR